MAARDSAARIEASQSAELHWPCMLTLTAAGAEMMCCSDKVLTRLQVGEYMTEMQEDSEENYNKHFSKYIEAGLEGEELEDTLKEVGCLAREGVYECLQSPATGLHSAGTCLVILLACW